TLALGLLLFGALYGSGHALQSASAEAAGSGAKGGLDTDRAQDQNPPSVRRLPRATIARRCRCSWRACAAPTPAGWPAWRHPLPTWAGACAPSTADPLPETRTPDPWAG